MRAAIGACLLATVPAALAAAPASRLEAAGETVLAAGAGVTSARVAEIDGQAGDELVLLARDEVAVARRDAVSGWTAHAVARAAPGDILATPADFDGNGRVDLLLRRSDGWLLLLQRADGSFEPRHSPPAPPAMASGVLVGDLDGDGDPDVIELAAAGSRIWLNGAHATAILTPVGAPLPAARDGLLLDADADGDLDAVLVAPDGVVALLVNDGDGSFSPLPAPIADGIAFAIGAADLDADGDIDLLLGAGDGSSPLLLRNGGALRFTTAPVAAVAQAPRALLDYDGDGFTDLLLVGGGGIEIARGGALGYAPAVPVTVRGAPVPVTRSVSTADFDRDGRVDVVLVADDGNVVVLRNLSETPNHWLGIDLRDTAGAAALDASVVAIRRDGGRISRQQSQPASVTLGLGQLLQIDLVVVYWGNGTVTRWQPDGFDRYYPLREPAATDPAPGRREPGTPKRFYVDHRYECR